MSTMIVGVKLVDVPEARSPRPWWVVDGEGRCEARLVREEDANREAEARGPGHRVEWHEMLRSGWRVEVSCVGSSLGGYSVCDSWGEPFASAEDAAAAAAPVFAKVGVVTQDMMGSSVFSIIVLRQQESGRWTAALGVGGHTVDVHGGYDTPCAAVAAAERERANRWADRLWHWMRTAARAGVAVTILAQYPCAHVVRPTPGTSVWDVLTTVARCGEGVGA